MVWRCFVRARLRLRPTGAVVVGCLAIQSATIASLSAQEPACYREPALTGRVVDSRIIEISGMVPVTDRPGHYWIHNDSDGRPRVFAVHESGSIIAVANVTGADAIDWEEIARGPGPETDGAPAAASHLYVADTGNNERARDELAIYRFREPSFPLGVAVESRLDTESAHRMRVRYPSERFDAEALVVDPARGDVYLLTKEDARCQVFRVGDPGSTSLQTLVAVTTFRPQGLVTAADVSADGRRLLVRTYDRILEYVAGEAAPFATIFGAAARVLPDSSLEAKSESICFDHAETAYLTTNEGNPAPIRIAREKISQPWCPEPTEESLGGLFVRGDVVATDSLGESVVDIGDLARLAESLSGGRTLDCEAAGDANDDDVLDELDVAALTAALANDERIPLPFPDLGLDPTGGDLPCDERERVVPVELGSEWDVADPRSPPPHDWNEPSGTGGAWQSRSTPIGFGVAGVATEVERTAEISLYARRVFELADAEAWDEAFLDIAYDDGFVAYLNGTEVARRGLGSPGFEPFPSELARRHTSTIPEVVPICTESLVSGTNLLAVEVHRRATTDRTLFFDARFRAVRRKSPAPPPTGLTPESEVRLSTARPPNRGDEFALEIVIDAGAEFRSLSYRITFPVDDVDVLRSERGRDAPSGIVDAVSVSRDGHLAYVAVATRDPFPAATDLEVARLLFRAREDAAQGITIEFVSRGGRLPLDERLGLADGRTIRLRGSPYVSEVTDLGTPSVSSLVGNRGESGTKFYLVGGRIEGGEVRVRVCGREANVERLDAVTLRVSAPACERAGYALLELCNALGCITVDEGFFYESAGVLWLRGDANGDGSVDIADALRILGALFSAEDARGAPKCPTAVDVNDDGAFDIADAIFLLNFLFSGSVDLPPPYPEPAVCRE